MVDDMDTHTLGLGFVALAEIERLIDAKFDGDIYTQAIANLFQIRLEDVTKEQRLWIKNLSFGVRFSGGVKVEPGIHDEMIVTVPGLTRGANR